MAVYSWLVKAYIKAGLLATGILAFVSFGMSAFLVRSLLQKVPDEKEADAPRYHFILYVPDDRSDFVSRIVAGARSAASDFDAAISVHAVDFSGSALRMASWAGSDGIAVYPDVDDAKVRETLETLRADGVPVVLVNHNIPSERPWPFIGTNNFDFGKKAAQIAMNATEADLRIAVVYSDKNPSIFAERELVEMGINGVVGNRMSTTVTALKTDMNPQAAEQIVYQLVRTMPSLTTIIFTDVNDTLAGTQALIDLNLVGRIQIIGFGSDPEIVSHIKKGIVSASLVVDPERIGYQSMRALAELRGEGYTSTSVDTGITVLAGE